MSFKKYAMLYSVGTASSDHTCIVEIWEYGFKQLTKTDVECTVYYIKKNRSKGLIFPWILIFVILRYYNIEAS